MEAVAARRARDRVDRERVGSTGSRAMGDGLAGLAAWPRAGLAPLLEAALAAGAPPDSRSLPDVSRPNPRVHDPVWDRMAIEGDEQKSKHVGQWGGRKMAKRRGAEGRGGMGGGEMEGSRSGHVCNKGGKGGRGWSQGQEKVKGSMSIVRCVSKS